MKNLKEYLDGSGISEELVSVILTLASSIARISTAVGTSDTGKAGSTNVFGEEQLALDVLSDKVLIEGLKTNSAIGIYASEEQVNEVKLSEGKYAVAADPLDGSSLVDTNLAVGTIIGIYETNTFIGRIGDEQVASMIAVYGPRTTIVLTVKKGVQEFSLQKSGEFVMSRENIKVGEGKMFAPGNLRACSVREDYFALVSYWCKEQYTLRYSGGMVPDVNQILIKGKGIFTFPGYGDTPNGKLRLLYECAPISLLMEQAGGAGSDGKMRLLEKKIESLDQRTPIFVGSREEVKRCEEFLG